MQCGSCSDACTSQLPAPPSSTLGLPSSWTDTTAAPPDDPYQAPLTPQQPAEAAVSRARSGQHLRARAAYGSSTLQDRTICFDAERRHPSSKHRRERGLSGDEQR